MVWLATAPGAAALAAQRGRVPDTIGWEDWARPARCVPDLDDDATGGALLSLLRAAWVTDADHWVAVCLDVGDDGPPVTVECFGMSSPRYSRPFHTGAGPTLAHACAAALVAIGRCA